MTTKEIQLQKVEDVQSLLVRANGIATITNIVYDNDDGETIPVREVEFPIQISNGTKLIVFSKPIEAIKIEILGVGLEYIQGVSVNDSTMANELQQQIDDIVGGSQAFTHYQASPSADFTFTHPLPFKPSPSVEDSTGRKVEATISWPSASQVRVKLAGAMVCWVHCS